MVTVKPLFVFVLVIFSIGPARAQSPSCNPQTCAYLNPALSPVERARDLVQRMTLEEKVSQTMNRAAAIPRLGVAEYDWWSEGLHGVASSGVATVFPQAIALAASWDPEMVRGVADTISTEARARFNTEILAGRSPRFAGLTYWSPNINIFRDPRWGRGQETYGEDPFLTASIGTSFIRGLQGTDSRYLKLVATPKHFAVHSGPEPTRHGFNAQTSPFDLEDTYLPAFRAAITEAGADSIMCAYSALDGVPDCANDLLLGERLRNAWHFNGFVVSDCDAVADVVRGHHYAPDPAHGDALSLIAGTDLDCGRAYQDLLRSVKQGLLTENQLDTAVVRLFTARMRLGMFDPPQMVPWSHLSAKDIGTAEHRALALQAAERSLVLLQNRSHILPLAPGKRLAVVGPTAELLQAVRGNYSGVAESPVLPLDGLRKAYGADMVSYSPGSVLAEGAFSPIPATALRTELSGGEEGLRAEYFDHPDFSGEPAVRKVDRMLNFDWERTSPDAKLQQSNFAMRWTGAIDFPASGTYSIRLRGVPRRKAGADVTGQGVNSYAGEAHLLRIWIDDGLILDSAEDRESGSVTVPAAGRHRIRVEYIQLINVRTVSLDWQTPIDALLPDAIHTAERADFVIAVVGLSPDLEGEQMGVEAPGFAGGDRTDLALPPAQERLLHAMKATGKPLVVVLTSGSCLSVNWENDNADAILEAWYGGEEAGTALAETLIGRNNPAGRLPVTFYRSVTDLPAFDDYSMKHRTYRYFDKPVLYPFGFGLSYAAFRISDVKLDSSSLPAGEEQRVSALVTNVSSIPGDEVMEVYIRAPGGRRNAPFLAAFSRVSLAPGEARRVILPLPQRQLSRVDARGARSIQAGRYAVYVVDNGAPDRKAAPSAAFVVTGVLRLLQ